MRRLRVGLRILAPGQHGARDIRRGVARVRKDLRARGTATMKGWELPGHEGCGSSATFNYDWRAPTLGSPNRYGSDVDILALRLTCRISYVVDAVVVRSIAVRENELGQTRTYLTCRLPHHGARLGAEERACAEALCGVVVDHSDGLHEGVANLAAYELEAAAL